MQCFCNCCFFHKHILYLLEYSSSCIEFAIFYYSIFWTQENAPRSLQIIHNERSVLITILAGFEPATAIGKERVQVFASLDLCRWHCCGRAGPGSCQCSSRSSPPRSPPHRRSCSRLVKREILFKWPAFRPPRGQNRKPTSQRQS